MLKCTIDKELGAFKLGIDLIAGNKELLVILGPSGCGKSTLLNCIAGLTALDAGYIELDKKVYVDVEKDLDMAIHQRQIGYIQQGNTLFPHLSVRENILYSVAKSKRHQVDARYKDLLESLDIQSLEHRLPVTLSGGQQQRVAIARALMMSPKLILWDEPFSALDHMIREDLRQLVLDLKRKLSIPMIFVTHDLEEAFQLADRLGVMDNGRILQLADRDWLFNSPVNAKVGKTLGITNILEATYAGSGPTEDIRSGALVSFKIEELSLSGVDIDERLKNAAPGTRVNIGIRPEQILYVREDENSARPFSANVAGNVFKARVLSVVKYLENYRLKIILIGLRQPLMMDIPRGVIQRYDIYEGCDIKVLLKYKRVIVMDALGCQENTDSNQAQLQDQVLVDESAWTYERYRKLANPNYLCPVIGISGVSNSGKTTVMEKIIRMLAEKGIRVGTIKHDGHGFEMDHPGKDTHRHRMAGASSVMIASKDRYSILYSTEQGEIQLEQLILQQSDVDIVLVEGYKFSPLPKFEVIRAARSAESVCRQESLLGVITDIETKEIKKLSPQVPRYDNNDLAKLVEIIEKIIKEASHEG